MFERMLPASPLNAFSTATPFSSSCLCFSSTCSNCLWMIWKSGAQACSNTTHDQHWCLIWVRSNQGALESIPAFNGWEAQSHGSITGHTHYTHTHSNSWALLYSGIKPRTFLLQDRGVFFSSHFINWGLILTLLDAIYWGPQQWPAGLGVFHSNNQSLDV